MLAVFDPAGAAGGDQKQGPPFSRRSKLGSLLHDGQVGGEIDVEHLVEKPRRRRAVTILPVTLAPSGMPKGSPSVTRMEGATPAMTILFSSCSFEYLGIVASRSAGGAGYDALSAADACHICNIAFEGAADMGLKPRLLAPMTATS